MNAGESNEASLQSPRIKAKIEEPTPQICPHNTNVSCASCRLNELCLPIALNKSEIHQLDEIVYENKWGKACRLD